MKAASGLHRPRWMVWVACSLIAGHVGAAPPLWAVTEDRPPDNYRDPSGRPAGAHVETLRLALARSGLTADILLFPWARSYTLAQTRPNTLIFRLARLPERERRFIWVAELKRQQAYFYRAPFPMPFQPRTLAAIRDCCRVCVVNQDATETVLRRHGFRNGQQLVSVNSVHDCLRLVGDGSVNFFVTSPALLDTEAAHTLHGRLHFEQVLPLGEPNRLYLAAHPQTDPVIVEKLRATLETMQMSGEIERIRQRYQSSAAP
ncbi:amino acid ABC transporter substrate-binding protein, PAAT family (TC 3.A.1.3.-) [Gulbenkiania indica]|uniref:Amino acid ABC transporter substrate-binding protein, PAAT family (TC 3.A.1.3.-) n=1 Tax=Gulbenkiania indica TaxID=375574 RepID=A0A0K6GVN8_9NEIS|nr:transporter substrate-binding domain-containing protein [Gulbenkiania indica]CUA82635.1 amino acid ABC transporter substrate-binding protein, PAAT family (TC 3.A.1.3.-) [Gulbenkiania indica]